MMPCILQMRNGFQTMSLTMPLNMSLRMRFLIVTNHAIPPDGLHSTLPTNPPLSLPSKRHFRGVSEILLLQKSAVLSVPAAERNGNRLSRSTTRSSKNIMLLVMGLSKGEGLPPKNVSRPRSNRLFQSATHFIVRRAETWQGYSTRD